jgi:hypothetical protein
VDEWMDGWMDGWMDEKLTLGMKAHESLNLNGWMDG